MLELIIADARGQVGERSRVGARWAAQRTPVRFPPRSQISKRSDLGLGDFPALQEAGEALTCIKPYILAETVGLPNGLTDTQSQGWYGWLSAAIASSGSGTHEHGPCSCHGWLHCG